MRWLSRIADNRGVENWVTLEAPERLPSGSLGLALVLLGAFVVVATAASLWIPGAWAVVLLAAGAFIAYTLFTRSRGPRVVLSANSNLVAAGDQIRVRCEIRDGSPSWLPTGLGRYLDEGWRARTGAELKLYFEGHEEMILRVYNAEIYRDEFLSQSLGTFDASAPITVSVHPPAEGMPSFSGKNCRVFWAVRAETLGWKPPWPFPGTVYGELTVLPARDRTR